MKKFKDKRVKILLEIVNEEKKLLIVIVFLTVISTYIGSFFPKYTQIMIDNGYELNNIIILFFLGLASPFLNYVSFKTKIVYLSNLKLKISDKFVNRLLKFRYEFFKNNDMGNIFQRISNDIDSITSFTGNFFSELIRNTFSILIIIPLMINMSLYIAVPVILITVTMVASNVSQGKRITDISQDIRYSNDILTSYILKLLSNIEIIKADVVENETKKKYLSCLKNYVYNIKRSTDVSNILSLIVNALSTVIVCVIFGVGVILLDYGLISIGEIVGFSLYYGMLYQRLSSLVSLKHSWCNVIPSVDRYLEYMMVEIENYDGIRIEVPKTISFDNALVINGSFSKKYNFSFTNNGLYVIVGENGTGKSTLIKSIMGFHKVVEGCIMINNYAIENLDISSLRENISYLPQTDLMLDGNVLDVVNAKSVDINYYDKLIKVFCLDFIDHGFIINEDANLSGGELQGLQIIKCLINKKAIIIMDEPTNNLDKKRKEVLIRELNKIKKDHIIIVVSHDQEIIKIADSILEV